MDAVRTHQERDAAETGGQHGELDRLNQVRARLRHDVLFGDNGEGVYIHHADGGFVVKGRSAYRWMSAIAPYLDGRSTVGELCEGLTEDRRQVVHLLLRTLLDRGFVRDVPAPGASTIPAAVRERFANQLGFVEHFVDSADERFTAFREARVLVLGQDEVALAAATALMRNGLARTDLVGDRSLPDALVAEAAAIDDVGASTEVRVVAASPADLTPAALREYDTVIAPGTALGLAGTRDLTRQGRANGFTVHPLVVVGRFAYVGPITGGTGPCLDCALLRIGSNRGPEVAARIWQDVAVPGTAFADVPLTANQAAVLGNELAFEVFKDITGCTPAEARDAVIVHDLDSGDSRAELLLPHPSCPQCADRAVGVPSARPGGTTPSAELSDGDLAERQNMLFGPHAGMFTEYDDGGFLQIPVKVARLRFAHPVEWLTPRELVGFDVDNVYGARGRLFHGGLVAYTDEIGGGRSAGGAAAPDGHRIEPAALEIASGLAATPVTGWFPATALGTGEPCAVPAAAVFATGAPNRSGLFEATRAGGGAGPDVVAATRTGLLSALTYGALRAALRGSRPARHLDLRTLPADPALAVLDGAVRRYGLDLRLLHLTGGAPASVVLATGATADGRFLATALGAGTTCTEAAVTALVEVVGRHQLRLDQGDGFPVDTGDPLLAGLDLRAIRVAADDAGESTADGTVTGAGPGEELDALVAAVRASGREGYLVDTTTPDVRAAGFCTVRVLLSREQGTDDRASDTDG